MIRIPVTVLVAIIVASMFAPSTEAILINPGVVLSTPSVNMNYTVASPLRFSFIKVFSFAIALNSTGLVFSSNRSVNISLIALYSLSNASEVLRWNGTWDSQASIFFNFTGLQTFTNHSFIVDGVENATATTDISGSLSFAYTAFGPIHSFLVTRVIVVQLPLPFTLAWFFLGVVSMISFGFIGWALISRRRRL